MAISKARRRRMAQNARRLAKKAASTTGQGILRRAHVVNVDGRKRGPTNGRKRTADRIARAVVKEREAVLPPGHAPRPAGERVVVPDRDGDPVTFQNGGGTSKHVEGGGRRGAVTVHYEDGRAQPAPRITRKGRGSRVRSKGIGKVGV